MSTCPNCGYEGPGNYCSQCGQSFLVKRISIKTILHEVSHLFTHLDKGFLFTLKQLAIRPGKMQKEYIRGSRSSHQKPFSMFFICATITGLALYWISKQVSDAELSEFEKEKIYYFRHYYVFTQSLLIPFYTFVVWLLFRNKYLNYAEVLVMFVYTLAFMFLLVSIVNFLNLVSGKIETTYVEIALLAIYSIWTYINFFDREPVLRVIIKSFIALLICWFVSNALTNELIRWLV